MTSELILPDWPAPQSVRACSTTRRGGVSQTPYDSLNLGAHVGDRPEAVLANRQRLVTLADLPAMPQWLNQVHGTQVVSLSSSTSGVLTADAAYTNQPGLVCAVMTADCLPVLFCSDSGDEVAAAHAGWRGLCSGVLEATLHHFRAPTSSVMAWLGPAIGPQAFEVGPEVRDAFIEQHPAAADAFIAKDNKFIADIYQLARLRLQAQGVTKIFGGDACTVTQADKFFSYRRDGTTGRMASLIWLI
ncbi:polyphenol oxidase [Candidatus Symbiopectobacterium sp. NZEC127]|uniref:purine nucleoside phosphorylase YfiH n=1 Tax=Candidatus Symbiopectobacterium sp. NZEC127 TaxID=2820472 RepID=UPI00222677F0|nr:purine nucleoside phosphorylase YfiH [Candidatus Symbiopectobacterium sp. NZEC127]MCW2488589.1 polyphenol oxidase [Candidatus Symbiopectobacterium sp. NZEC127]